MNYQKIYEIKRAKKLLEKHKLLDKAQKAKIEKEVTNERMAKVR